MPAGVKPRHKCSFALPTDHKPKQDTTGFLQQKGNSLRIPFQPMGMTLCGQRGHGGGSSSVCRGCIAVCDPSPRAASRQPQPGGCFSVFQQANGAELRFWGLKEPPRQAGASSSIPTRAREGGTWKTTFFKFQKSW